MFKRSMIFELLFPSLDHPKHRGTTSSSSAASAGGSSASGLRGFGEAGEGA